jgi:hypothetical protein
MRVSKSQLGERMAKVGLIFTRGSAMLVCAAQYLERSSAVDEDAVC